MVSPTTSSTMDGSSSPYYLHSSGPCTHCGRNNHSVDTCFLLHGLPEWYTEKYGDTGRGKFDTGRGRGRHTYSRGRGRGRGYTPRANNAQIDNTAPDLPDVPGVSKETWSAIVNLLKSDSTPKHDKLSGKLACADFLLDSGASHHMTGDLDLLSDVHEIPLSVIVLPNDKQTYATKQGKMNLGNKMIISGVLFVPDLTCTLISLARLLRELSCSALFTDKLCLLQDRTSKMLIGAGEEQHGVYLFRGPLSASAHRVKRVHSKELWHQRLGHPSNKVLSSFLSSLAVIDTNISDFPEFCDVCIRAKQTRAIFPESFNKADDCFSLIHCDIWGPYHLASTSGAHYFLTIVDDHSRAVWTYLLLAKSEVSIVLPKFITMVANQFHKHVKTVRSDNGAEFISLRPYFSTKGILHQTSCVYTPQQNGRVERKHRHILNMARSLLFQADLPLKFWGESVLTAAYLINRTPTPLLHGKTPYEVLFSQVPSYDQLRVFGSLCFAKKHSARSDKFQARGRPCIFLGYPHGQKGWRVYDIDTHEFFTSRDVIFMEEIFPFATRKDPPSAVSDNPSSSPSFFADDDTSSVEHPSELRSSSRLADITGPHATSPIPPVLGTDLPPADADTSAATPEEASATADLPQADSSVLPDTDTLLSSPLGDEPLGRGFRKRRPSVLLDNYVLNSTISDVTPTGSSLYPLANFVTCARFSESHQRFLAAVNLLDEPVTYKQAMKTKSWCDAMASEVSALELNHTWDLEPLPSGFKALGSKWVFRLKFNSDGTLERHKARLVALGNHQQEGIDFYDTFAPVVKMQTVRLLLSVAAAKQWEVHQMDVHNAFLHGDLDEVIYMKPPPGFRTDDPSLVCRLRKSIYGLKQSPRCWFAKLSTALLEYGFVQCRKDYSFFAFSRGSVSLYVLVYVDDLVICGNDSPLIGEFKTYLSTCFKMKDLGVLKYFLGIEVARSTDGIYLSQRKYCLDIIDECGLSGSRPADTPMEQNHRLASSTSNPHSDPEQYRRLIGRFVYLTHTKPEISYAVNLLAQFMTTPLSDHWTAAVRLVRYLKSCPGQGILLSSNSPLQLTGFCDSDWATCPLTRRSLTGYIVHLGGSPISWKTKKQRTVSRSSAEAEYRAMAETCAELMWVKEVLHFIGISHTQPMRLTCDSKSALHIAANPVFHERTKHIEVDCHFIRDEITAGNLSTSYVHTTEQPADIFTKSLGRAQFRYLLDKLGVLDLHTPP